MRFLFLGALVAVSSAIAQLPAPGTPGAPKDTRYCGEPARYADGTIIRSRRVLGEFAAQWACPATGLHVTSCTGWHIDHVIPLATGGCDLPHNLAWMPVQIKQCRKDAPWNKDCWERKVYFVKAPS